MQVLYLGGTGEISPGCIQASLERDQQITVFNRGHHNDELPDGARTITGDMNDPAAYAALGERAWDVVCQFRAFDVEQAKRDVDVFGGRCGQYVFISSASAYEKPPRRPRITEQTPLANPFWEYSRRKAEIEAYLAGAHDRGDMPVTIVRPSHTIRTRLPGTFVSGDHLAWRMRHGKPVVVHGDGSSLWVITHSGDFGKAFAGLLGHERALGEAFHITTDEANTWDRIVGAMADELGVEAGIVHVASDTLARYRSGWAGPLLGDKARSVIFDNTKIKQAVDGWACEHTMRDAIRLVAPHVRRRLETFEPDAQTDALIDRVISDQARLGDQS